LVAKYEKSHSLIPLPLIQERILGPGCGVFVLLSNSEVRALFGHRRLREKPPSGGVSVLRESVLLNPMMKEYALRLLKRLNWHGVAMVEFKCDSRDNIQIRSYEWTFMDGTSQVLSGANPTHTFETLGNYEVTLRVTDHTGHWDTDIIWVNVSAADLTTGVISGRVTDENGDPLEGALVTVAFTPYFALTDASGYYSIGNVPPGTYELLVTKDGFQKGNLSEVNVNAGQVTSNQDITLPIAPEKTKASPFELWWVIVLVGAILFVLILFLWVKQRESGEMRIQTPERHDIYAPRGQPMQREYPPSYTPPTTPRHLVHPQPPQDYIEGKKASDSEE